MFASSRFGKFHAWDRVLARLKLRGDETVSMSVVATGSC
jgi:hypothetical protein